MTDLFFKMMPFITARQLGCSLGFEATKSEYDPKTNIETVFRARVEEVSITNQPAMTQTRGRIVSDLKNVDLDKCSRGERTDLLNAMIKENEAIKYYGPINI